MNYPTTELTALLATEAAQIPSMYGRIDFSITPERFTVEPDAVSELGPEFSQRRPELLANEELVARIKAYTMHGDPVADAYAALIPKYGFHRLATMLEQALGSGFKECPPPAPRPLP